LELSASFYNFALSFCKKTKQNPNMSHIADIQARQGIRMNHADTNVMMMSMMMCSRLSRV